LTSWGGGSIGMAFWYKLYIWIGGWRKKIVDAAIKVKCTRVICGHMHVPEKLMIKGVEYINLGDWMGNSSWAEDTGSGIKLYHFKDVKPTEIL